MSNERRQSDGPIEVLSRRAVEGHYGFLSEVAPAYDGPTRLLNWKHDGRVGMTVDMVLSLPGPLGSHAFRGMPEGKEAGQRFICIVSLPKQADGGVSPVIYHGETLLLKWSENGRDGMMARMLIDDGPDGVRGRHPFFGLPMGRLTGEPMDLVAWGIGDDEHAVPPSRLRQRTPFHTLTEVQQSHILCRNPEFRRFLLERLHQLIEDDATRESVLALRDTPEQFAAAAVRAALKVGSRSVMNKDGQAAQMAIIRWRAIVGRYEDWRWGIRRV